MRSLSFACHPPVVILGLALVVMPVTGRLNAQRSQAPHHVSRTVQQHLHPHESAKEFPAPSDDGAVSGSGEPPRQPHHQPRLNADISLPFGVEFSLPPLRDFQRAIAPVEPVGSYELAQLFEGNSYSLVAKAVGAAEGTRTPSGGYTRFFNGHTDPGNGVWNLGTFSYQHGASSPEEADRKQLRRLMGQASDIRYRAARANVHLGLEEELNGIDLANQSPLAALGKPGYAEWLAEAYENGLRGQEAILWARVQGYWDVDRGRWNAPGLGNTEPLIRRDQHRRMQAVAQAIAQSPLNTLASNDNSTPIVPNPPEDVQAIPSRSSDEPTTQSGARSNSGDRRRESSSEASPSSEDGLLNFRL